MILERNQILDLSLARWIVSDNCMYLCVRKLTQIDKMGRVQSLKIWGRNAVPNSNNNDSRVRDVFVFVTNVILV